MRFRNKQVQETLAVLRQESINLKYTAGDIADNIEQSRYYPRELTLPKLARRRKQLEVLFREVLKAHDQLVQLHKPKKK